MLDDRTPDRKVREKEATMGKSEEARRTKSCRSCREAIHAKARKCPHCRTNQGMSLLKGIGVFFLFSWVASAFMVTVQASNQGAPSKSAPMPTASARKPTPAPRPAPTRAAASGWYRVVTDSRAQYRAESVSKNRAGNLVLLTERRGPSGTSWAEREIDCRTGLVRYLHEGDTLAELRAHSYPKPQEMKLPFPDSITGEQVLRNCPRLTAANLLGGGRI